MFSRLVSPSLPFDRYCSRARLLTQFEEQITNCTFLREKPFDDSKTLIEQQNTQIWIHNLALMAAMKIANEYISDNTGLYQ